MQGSVLLLVTPVVSFKVTPSHTDLCVPAVVPAGVVRPQQATQEEAGPAPDPLCPAAGAGLPATQHALHAWPHARHILQHGVQPHDG